MNRKIILAYALMVLGLIVSMSMCAHTAATCDGTVVEGIWRYECIEGSP